MAQSKEKTPTAMIKKVIVKVAFPAMKEAMEDQEAAEDLDDVVEEATEEVLTIR